MEREGEHRGKGEGETGEADAGKGNLGKSERGREREREREREEERSAVKASWWWRVGEPHIPLAPSGLQSDLALTQTGPNRHPDTRPKMGLGHMQSPGEGVWGPGQPWLTRPPTHIRKIFLRVKVQFMKEARNLRPILRCTNFFGPLTLPPPPATPSNSLVNRQVEMAFSKIVPWRLRAELLFGGPQMYCGA